MRAKDLVYHLQCFVCVICSRVLTKGIWEYKQILPRFRANFGLTVSGFHLFLVLGSSIIINIVKFLTGDHFGMRSSGLYCETHYNLISTATEDADNQPTPHYFNGVGTGVKGRPRKQRKDSQGLQGGKSFCVHTFITQALSIILIHLPSSNI